MSSPNNNNTLLRSFNIATDSPFIFTIYDENSSKISYYIKYPNEEKARKIPVAKYFNFYDNDSMQVAPGFTILKNDN